MGDDFVGLDDLFGSSDEAEFEFTRSPSDLDANGVQAAVLHPEAELTADFLDPVLLETVVHGSHSTVRVDIATGKFRENR